MRGTVVLTAWNINLLNFGTIFRFEDYITLGVICKEVALARLHFVDESDDLTY